MRTDMTGPIGPEQVRGVVTLGALFEIAETEPEFGQLLSRLATGNAKAINAVMVATMTAAGQVKSVAARDAARLIETYGLRACAEWCMRLIKDAWDKADQAGKADPAPGSGTAAG